MTASSSILAVSIMTIVIITIFMIKSILYSASKNPEKSIDENFIKKYGFLIEDLR